MKKKKIQPNAQVHKLPGAPIATSNQLRLKQIYDSAYNSREKSPIKNNPYTNKNPLSTRYQLPLTDRKTQHLRPTRKENTRYQSYLEHQMVNQVRPNRRYQPIPRGNADKQRSSLGNNRESSNGNARDRSYDIENPIRKRQQNESVDMFKIRRSKQKISSRKISATNLSRSVNRTVHINNPMPPPTDNINNVLEVQFQQGKKLYKQGKMDESLHILEDLLTKDSKNSQYLYQTAMVHLSKKNYKSGLELLDRICRNDGGFKKTVYLFAAISAKNMQLWQQSIQYCSKGLQVYPNYLDLLSYRAKVHQMKGQFEQAHQDYDHILSIDKNNIEIMIKNAQALRRSGAFANSLSNLSNALYADQKGEFKQEILMKKIQIYLNQNHLQLKQAKKDLNKLISLEPRSSQTLYLKGKIMLYEGFKKQAVLCFQQSIKEASAKEPMSKSLIEITKRKINERDFYSAYYHICRSQYLDLQSPQIQIYKLFTEGVVYLMKRKISEGNNNFTKLVAKYPQICPDLKTIFYLYRAFAHFCLSMFKQSIQDYQLAHEFEPLDVYARFNKLLAEGIVEVNQRRYEKGIQFFDQAQKIINFTKLNKVQPSLYRSATHIQKAKDLLNNETKKQMEELKSLQQIFSALKQLDHAYDLNDGNSNMLYYRSLIYLHLGKFDQALQDIIKAISKSQENVAKYFFFRALAHASLGNLKQALNDFNICNNLDQKFYMVYLERAKINFANQNVTKGLEDLIKLKNNNPAEDIKYHQACLNYVYGHFIMANACCDQIADQQKARDIKILIKTKIGRLKQAKKLARAKADIMIYQILQGNVDVTQQSPNDLEYFTLYHYQHYLGVSQFMKGDFEKAIDMFIMATKQRTLYDLEQGISNNDLNENQGDHQNNEDDQEVFDGDSDKDTIHMINFNIFVTYLMMREWKKGYEVFIRDIIGAKSSLLKNQYMATFSHLLFQSIKSPQSEIPAEEKQVYQLNLYDSKLSRSQRQLVIELPNIIIKTRLVMLGLCNQKLQKKYRTRVDPDFILNYMKMSEIQNRPEPPWVKREDSGLIFTDEVQNINVEFQTTQNDESEEEDEEDDEQGEEEQDEEYEGDSEDEGEEQNKEGQISVNKFKQKMKLDDSIERKLQRIMEKKKKVSASGGKPNI